MWSGVDAVAVQVTRRKAVAEELHVAVCTAATRSTFVAGATTRTDKIQTK